MCTYRYLIYPVYVLCSCIRPLEKNLGAHVPVCDDTLLNEINHNFQKLLNGIIVHDLQVHVHLCPTVNTYNALYNPLLTRKELPTEQLI